MRKAVFFFLAAPIGIALTAAALGGAGDTAGRSPAYRIAEVRRDQVTAAVVAAGTIQPVVSVVVGSQVSGQMTEVLVDHNDEVTQGQPIARLDPELFATRVEAARAEVDVAINAVRIAEGELVAVEAAVNRAVAERAKADAEIKRSMALVENARKRLERKSILLKNGSNAVSDTDDARAAYETTLAELGSATAQVGARDAEIQAAEAQLAVARSRVAHAEVHVRRSRASLRQAEADLERTVIRAPIDGIVIDRSVAAGQTVAASFQAPTLFTIGDLHAVHVETAVDEADIGRVRVGQRATFAVDAYPDTVFAGSVTQVRKSPHSQESVVSYTVLLAATNDELLLLPGMTATAQIITDMRPDALQVPNAALRYRPQGIPPPAGPHVWVLDGGEIRPMSVRVGISNGGLTEVDGGLSVGQKVVVGDAVMRTDGSLMEVVNRLGAKVAGWMKPMKAALAELTAR